MAALIRIPLAGDDDAPHSGFIIGDGHCGQPGPEHHLICLGPHDHEGDHAWRDWRGCRVRLPGSSRTVPFGGFAY